MATTSQTKKVEGPLPPVDPNQRYDVHESAAYLRQSVSQTYKDIAAQRIRTIPGQRRKWVPGTEIIRLSRLPDQQGAQ